MGSLFAGLLAECRESVTLIGTRADHLAAIARSGLRLQTDAGDRQVPLATASPAQVAAGVPACPDVLMVWTKSGQTRAALEGVRTLIGAHTHLLSLQNGLGSAEVLGEFAPRTRVIVGVTNVPADRLGAGHVGSHGSGFLRMMSADGRDHDVLQRTATALQRAGLACEIDPEIDVAIWEKVAFNTAMNALCAVSGARVGEIAAHDPARELAFTVAAEAVAVARAAGVAAQLPRVHAAMRHGMAHHAQHQPSMLQDVLAHRPTEIDAINGAVVVAADRLGVAVPHTRTLLTLVQVIDRRHASERADRTQGG